MPAPYYTVLYHRVGHKISLWCLFITKDQPEMGAVRQKQGLFYKT